MLKIRKRKSAYRSVSSDNSHIGWSRLMIDKPNNRKDYFKQFLMIIAILGLFFYTYAKTAYALGLPLPNISLITNQIESVATAASGAMSAVGGVAESAQSAGLPVATPGIGLGQALQSFESLTADVSKMQEMYQNIVINYNKLGHLINSVQDAVSSVNNLNNQIKSAFNEIPNGLTQNDIQQTSNPSNLINSNINNLNSDFTSLVNSSNNAGGNSFQGISNIISGESSNTATLAATSQSFANSMVFDSNGNNGVVASPNINCPSYNEGNASLCTNSVDGFVNDVSASDLYNVGVSTARAHKAELEGDEFENEIINGTLGSSSNYYAYQSSLLTLMAEENAAGLKNMGYIESQLKQIELTKSANDIKKEHISATLLPDANSEPDLNFYNQTTL